MINKKILFLSIPILFSLITSCHKSQKKEEQLTIMEYQQQSEADSSGIPITGNSTSSSLITSSNSVLLTGMDRFRLITIYKVNPASDRNIQYYESTTYNSYYNDEDGDYKYFMPGLDIIYGYNLVNVAHYDMETEKLSYFFDNPVLIKTLYFPGTKKDSLNQKPISRNYFLVSVYDEDTNKDSLINKKDLRKIYHIDQFNSKKTLLLPAGYSAIRSTYDYKNDIMYLYARQDSNGNGTPEKNEPVSIFWIQLSNPTVVKKIM